MLKHAGFPWVGEDLIHNLLYHTVVVLPMAGGVYKTVCCQEVLLYIHVAPTSKYFGIQ